MIKLNRPEPEPVKLAENRQLLQEKILIYGDIDSIPPDIRKKLIKGYKNSETQASLFSSSHNKCSYCEIIPYSSYLEIEHFEPKELYKNRALDWDNLLPACTICNKKKGVHDTLNYPIINPYELNPEEYFIYTWLSIKPSDTSPDFELSERTIKVCKLNRLMLRYARVEIIDTLENYTETLEHVLNKFEQADTQRKKENRIADIRDSIEIFETLTLESKKFSGLCRYYLNTSIEFIKAKEILDSFE